MRFSFPAYIFFLEIQLPTTCKMNEDQDLYRISARRAEA